MVLIVKNLNSKLIETKKYGSLNVPLYWTVLDLKEFGKRQKSSKKFKCKFGFLLFVN